MENDHMKEEMDQMKEQLEEAKSEIFVLTRDLDAELEKYEKLKTEAENAKNFKQKTFECTLSVLESEKDQMEERLEDAKSQITALSRDLKSEQNKNQKLNEEAEKSKAKIEAQAVVVAKRVQGEAEIDAIILEKEELTILLADFEEDSKSVRKQVESLQKDIAQLKEAHTLQMEAQSLDLARKQAESAELDSIKMEKEELNILLTASQREVIALKSQLKTLQMGKEVEVSAEDKQCRYNNMELDLEASLKKNRTQRRRYNNLSREIAELKAQLEKNQDVIKRSEQAVKDHALCAEKAKLVESVENEKCRYKNMELDLEASLKKNKTQKRRCTTLNREIAELKARLEQNEDIIVRSEMAINDHALCAEKEQNANETIEDLENRLKTKSEKITKFRGYLEDITDTINMMLNVTKFHPNKVPQLFEKKLKALADKTLENGNLRAKITELEEMIADLNADLEAAVVAEEIPKKKKKGFFKKLGAKIRRRQSDEAKQKKDTIHKLQAKIDELELLKSRMTTETKNAKKVNQGLDKVLSNMKTKEQSLSDEIAKLRYKVRVRENTIDELHDAIRSFEELAPVTPRELERETNAVLRDVVLINQFRGSGQSEHKQVDPLNDLDPFDEDEEVPDGQCPLQYLAEGSFGQVELGRLAYSGVPIVVKTPMLTPGMGDDLESFEMKANTLRAKKEAMIHHMFTKNRLFPRFHGVIKMMNQISLVLEFVGDKKTGKIRSLVQVLSKVNPDIPFPTRVEIVGIADDIVQAVSALHKKSILHNDIKADNVLLEIRKNVWRATLIDFGEASSFAVPLVKNSSLSMRMQYGQGLKYLQLAPEVVLDQQPTSVQSDIYSVGKIFQKLGEGGNIEDLTFLGEICSEKNPHSRPETIREVSAKLLAIKVKIEKKAENHRL